MLSIANEVSSNIDYIMESVNVTESDFVNKDPYNTWLSDYTDNQFKVNFFDKINNCCAMYYIPDRTYVNTAIQLINTFIKKSKVISNKIEHTLCKEMQAYWESIGKDKDIPGVDIITKYTDIPVLYIDSIGAVFHRPNKPCISICGEYTIDPYHGFHVKIDMSNYNVIGFGLRDAWYD